MKRKQQHSPLRPPVMPDIVRHGGCGLVPPNETDEHGERFWVRALVRVEIVSSSLADGPCICDRRAGAALCLPDQRDSPRLGVTKGWRRPEE